ncbi:MAG: hypothetical protein ACI8Q1_001814 [Parvicella sp.]|jgi:uncharacterized protein (TIGR03084 family)
MKQAFDYLAEANSLLLLLKDQPISVFEIQTQFKSWTISDVIGHLYLFDIAALKTLESAEAFEGYFAPIRSDLSRGLSTLEIQYKHLGDLTGREIFEMWQISSKILSEAYVIADPKLRVRWAGPEMSALTCITARHMETWAHGQEVFDVLGVKRPATDRIRNICHLGVSTFSWTFINRKLPVPEQLPFVRLTSPSGNVWEWNDTNSINCVSGDATAFAQVVTQVRNIEDTNLVVSGGGAKTWMALAQCFAGPPITPPVKGSRFAVVNNQI